VAYEMSRYQRESEHRQMQRDYEATRLELAENEAHIKQLLATQIEDMREVLKSGVMSINMRGLWKQFLFALYADGEFAWYRPRSKKEDPPEGSLQVANLDRIVVGKNPHFIYLTSPLEKVELWCNSIPEVGLWAEEISKLKGHLDATSEAYHIAVTHDNVEACYNDRMKGIQQVKQALQHERLVSSAEGPVLLTAPQPARSVLTASAGPGVGYGLAGYGYGYGYGMAPGVGLEGEQLDHFAEHLYDDIETDLKASNGAMGASFAWMAQDVNPSAPLSAMDDSTRVAESLRRARLADRNAKEAFDRFEAGVAGTLASKMSKDVGVEVAVATPQPDRFYEAFNPSGPGYYGAYGYRGFATWENLAAADKNKDGVIDREEYADAVQTGKIPAGYGLASAYRGYAPWGNMYAAGEGGAEYAEAVRTGRLHGYGYAAGLATGSFAGSMAFGAGVSPAQRIMASRGLAASDAQ